MSFIRASAAFFMHFSSSQLVWDISAFPERIGTFVSIGGLFASLTAFEILALIFHITLGSLRVMTLLWCLLCGSIAAAGIWKKDSYAEVPKYEKKNHGIHTRRFYS